MSYTLFGLILVASGYKLFSETTRRFMILYSNSRTKITAENFEEIAKKHNSLWRYSGLSIETNKCTRWRLKAKLRCSSCDTWHWVFWCHVKTGRSTKCAKCAKLYAPAYFEKLKIKYGILWKPSGIFRSISDKNGRKCREFWCVCTGCGKGDWVRWRALQTGVSRSCRPCCMRLRKNGRTEPLSPMKKALRTKWNYMNRTRRKHILNHFKDLNDFISWSIDLGYKVGNELERVDKGGPYSRVNCKWATTGKENIGNNRNTVSVNYTNTISYF